MGRGMRTDDADLFKRRERSLRIGICTRDFSTLHDLIKELRKREISYIIVDPDEVWEGNMDCLLLDKGAEKPPLKQGDIELIRIEGGIKENIERAISISLGRKMINRMVVGIDPGKRPGMAFFADDKLIAIFKAQGPRGVLKRLKRAEKAYSPDMITIRLGSGDPKRRNGIIEILKGQRYNFEIVDERRTTIGKRFRDENAAIAIARTEGETLIPRDYLSRDPID